MREPTEFRCRNCGGPMPVEPESDFCLIEAEAFCPACEREYARQRQATGAAHEHRRPVPPVSEPATPPTTT